MYSGQPSGNGLVPFALCSCGAYLEPAQAQSSRYCDRCVRRIASQGQGQAATPPDPQGSNWYTSSSGWHPAWEQPQSGLPSGMPAAAETVAPSQSSWPTHPFPASVSASALPVLPELRSRTSSLRDPPSYSQWATLKGQDVMAGGSASIALPQPYVPARVDPSFNRGDGAIVPQDESFMIRSVASPATKAANLGRRIHDARFECNIPGCGATFTRDYNLTHHLNSHYGVKPHSCRWPGCSKAFGRPHDRARHEKGCAFFQKGVDVSQFE